MSDSTPPPASKGLLAFSETVAPEIFAFQRAAYPQRRPDWIEPRWRWMFLDSAARLGVAPMVWLYRGSSGIVAHQGAIPVRLKTGRTQCITGWFVETMALEHVRGRAIGPMIVAKARADLPFNISLGQTEKMRQLQYQLGWRHVAALPTFMFVLNGAHVLRGKLGHRLVETVAGAGLSVRQWLRRGARPKGAGGNWQTVALDRFDDRHDALWQSARAEYACAVERDASYLNWKYVDQPGQQCVRLEVRRDGVPVALAVMQVVEPDRAYRYRRGLLVDLVVRPSDDAAVHAALAAAERAGRRLGIDMLVLDLINATLVPKVRRFGFVERAAERQLLVALPDSPTADQERAVQADGWLVTRGDSDIDRPW